MARYDMDCHLSKIDKLASEIYTFVPSEKIEAQQFRADLAGLLVVTIAASYESCVKETLVNHASKHHTAFGDYALNNYSKINSKIRVNDLKRYATLFSPKISGDFSRLLQDRKKRISSRVGINIENRFEQILNWRHDFAHAWITNTTVEEAIKTHRYAKRILYVFDEAFNGR